MTLGDKIRRYRLLHGKTQKQLGEEVGFKKSTSDVRINQYETGKMAPKADIRSKIAEALDIDIEAISDIEISSFEDIMYILFELEESIGLDIEKKDGKTYLVLDDNNKDIRSLISYLNIWKNQKTNLASDPDNDEKINEYKLWKSRFVKNTQSLFDSKKEAIKNKYDSLVYKAADKIPYAKQSSDITRLLRKIIDSGISISTISFYGVGSVHAGYTFKISELLNPPSDEAAELFAQFLSEINRFNELGANCYDEVQMLDKAATITYYIPVKELSIIMMQIDEYIEFKNDPNNDNEIAIELFENSFNKDLKTYSNNIEDAISFQENE